jgi:hypothetical protein
MRYGTSRRPYERLPRLEHGRAVLEGSSDGAAFPASSADEPAGVLNHIPAVRWRWTCRASGLRHGTRAASSSRSARPRLPDKDDRALARSGPHEANPTARRVPGVGRYLKYRPPRSVFRVLLPGRPRRRRLGSLESGRAPGIQSPPSPRAP